MSKSRHQVNRDKRFYLEDEKKNAFKDAYTPAQKRFVKKIVRRHARQKGKQIISKELIREMIADFQDREIHRTFELYCNCKVCEHERNSEYYLSPEDIEEAYQAFSDSIKDITEKDYIDVSRLECCP